MSTLECLQGLRHCLEAARATPRSPLLSPHYAAGINDGLDVALNMIALEIQMAEADVAADVARAA